LQVSALRIRDLLEGRKDLLARCEKAERERDNYQKIVDALPEHIIGYNQVLQERDRLQAELAAIKGRREWGVRILGETYTGHVVEYESEAECRHWKEECPSAYDIVYRVKYTGPWEPSEPSAETKI
jgi:hypothetical protein